MKLYALGLFSQQTQLGDWIILRLGGMTNINNGVKGLKWARFIYLKQKQKIRYSTSFNCFIRSEINYSNFIVYFHCERKRKYTVDSGHYVLPATSIGF